MKQDSNHRNKRFKQSLRYFVIIGIVIVVATGLSAYIGLSKGQPNSKSNPIIMHIHPHLTITMDSKPFTVASQIGIDLPLWIDHTLDKYGMQEMAMAGGTMPGMAPLHTHDSSGIIHVESSVNRIYTLGEFFKVWGLNLNGKTVKATVDGKQVPDFKNIVLKDGEQIALDIKS